MATKNVCIVLGVGSAVHVMEKVIIFQSSEQVRSYVQTAIQTTMGFVPIVMGQRRNTASRIYPILIYCYNRTIKF